MATIAASSPVCLQHARLMPRRLMTVQDLNPLLNQQSIPNADIVFEVLASGDCLFRTTNEEAADRK